MIIPVWDIFYNMNAIQALTSFVSDSNDISLQALGLKLILVKQSSKYSTVASNFFMTTAFEACQ